MIGHGTSTSGRVNAGHGTTAAMMPGVLIVLVVVVVILEARVAAHDELEARGLYGELVLLLEQLFA